MQTWRSTVNYSKFDGEFQALEDREHEQSLVGGRFSLSSGPVPIHDCCTTRPAIWPAVGPRTLVVRLSIVGPGNYSLQRRKLAPKKEISKGIDASL